LFKETKYSWINKNDGGLSLPAGKISDLFCPIERSKDILGMITVQQISYKVDKGCISPGGEI
jgi:hypothetical protein